MSVWWWVAISLVLGWLLREIAFKRAVGRAYRVIQVGLALASYREEAKARGICAECGRVLDI